MKRRFAAAAALAVTFAAGGAPAEAAGPGEPSAFAVLQEDRAGDFWSDNAMAAAADVELPNVDPSAIPPVAGERAAPSFEASEPADEAVAAEQGEERGSGNIGRAPLHWSGRLFFVKGDGKPYRCSAQFISSTVILTAAHCVRDSATGRYYSNVAFALAYRDGKYRQLYKPTCMWTYGGWVQDGIERYPYDYAFLKVGEKSRTGHWGTSWDWDGRYDSATRTGYPSGILGGQVIQVDRGPIQVQSGIVEIRHGSTANQHGSSGGAWVGSFSNSVAKNNYVISVQSFSYDSKPGYSYGPYLDASAKKLRQLADGPCN